MSFFPKLRLLSQSQALLCKVMSQTKFARLAKIRGKQQNAAMFFNEVFSKVRIHLKITGGKILIDLSNLSIFWS